MHKTLLTTLLCSLLATAASAGADPRTWSYKNFKEDVPLTLDTLRIAIFDPTPVSRA
jgi:hypothetical protein